MKKSKAIIVASLAAICSSAVFAERQTTPDSIGQTEQPFVMQLVWADEFDIDGRPDSGKWGYEKGFVRNHEDQWYQPNNAYVQNGMLVIEARKEDKPRKNPKYKSKKENVWPNKEFIEYTSACLISKDKFDFRYGTVEVKAKIPTASGAWPAIWLLGTDKPWPENGEIDMMEYYRIDGVPHILANACWGSDTPYKAVWDSAKIPFSKFTDRDPDWASKFHIWRMDWDTEAIRLYLDNELLNEIPLSATVNGSVGKGSNAMTNNKYLLLNLAIGGDNGGKIDDSAFPMKYEIDYIRVYQ